MPSSRKRQASEPVETAGHTDPVNEFARLIYETLEHLDPTMDALDWGNFSEDQKEFYRQFAGYLLDRRSLVLAALTANSLANDDPVDRCAGLT